MPKQRSYSSESPRMDINNAIGRILKRLDRRLEQLENRQQRRLCRSTPSPGPSGLQGYKRIKPISSSDSSSRSTTPDIPDLNEEEECSSHEISPNTSMQENGTSAGQQLVVSQPDNAILSLLGTEDDVQKNCSDPIHSEVALHWVKILKNGLSEEARQDLLKRCVPPKNCYELNPPQINPEVKSAVADNILRRDVRLAQLQQQIGAATSAIGLVMTLMLKGKEGENELFIEVLNNAGRLLSDVHHSESVSRRELLSINLNKNLKETLKNTAITSLLFGADLDSTLKTARDLEKSSEQLKLQKKYNQSSPTTSRQGNCRRSPLTKKEVQQSGQNFRAPSSQRRPYYVNHRYSQKKTERQQTRERIVASTRGRYAMW